MNPGLPPLAAGFSWADPDDEGYVHLRYRGHECQRSQVQPHDFAGIVRVLDAHGARADVRRRGGEQ